MKIKLGKGFEISPHFGEELEVIEREDGFVCIKVGNDEVPYTKYEFERRLKNGMFVEIK